MKYGIVVALLCAHLVVVAMEKDEAHMMYYRNQYGAQYQNAGNRDDKQVPQNSVNPEVNIPGVIKIDPEEDISDLDISTYRLAPEPFEPGFFSVQKTAFEHAFISMAFCEHKPQKKVWYENIAIAFKDEYDDSHYINPSTAGYYVENSMDKIRVRGLNNLLMHKIDTYHQKSMSFQELQSQVSFIQHLEQLEQKSQFVLKMKERKIVIHMCFKIVLLASMLEEEDVATSLLSDICYIQGDLPSCEQEDEEKCEQEVDVKVNDSVKSYMTRIKKLIKALVRSDSRSTRDALAICKEHKEDAKAFRFDIDELIDILYNPKQVKAEIKQILDGTKKSNPAEKMFHEI